jgi:hypothetical protein
MTGRTVKCKYFLKKDELTYGKLYRVLSTKLVGKRQRLAYEIVNDLGEEKFYLFNKFMTVPEGEF